MKRDWTYTLWPKLIGLWLLSFLVPEYLAFRANPDRHPDRKTMSRALARWWGVQPRHPRRHYVEAGLVAGLVALIVHVETQPPLNT